MRTVRPQKANREKLQRTVPDRFVHMGPDYPSRNSNVQEVRTASAGPRTRARESGGHHTQLAREEPGIKLKAITSTIYN